LDRAEGLALREVHRVRGAQEGVRLAPAGRVDAHQVAARREDVRLVEDHPVRHAVAERPHHQLAELSEAARQVAIRPAARVLERLRQVPMVERGEGPDARLEQPVDQAAVVVEPGPVRRAASVRLDARPGDREAVAVQVHRALQRDVVAPAVVRVAGDVAVLIVLDLARRVAEAVPDRLALAVLARGPLDLVRGRRGAPAEALRELEPRHYAPSVSAASTCSGCASALATRAQCFFTLPSGPIQTVERITPVVFLPYITFSPHAAAWLTTLLWGPESSVKASRCLLENRWWDSPEPGDTPSTTAPSLRISFQASRKPQASLVQPGVSSRG